MSGEFDAMRDQVRHDILRAFDLKPWQVGLAPVPRRIRIWHKVAGPYVRWRIRRTDAHGGEGIPFGIFERSDGTQQ